MSVISVTILESLEQIVDGIPKKITLSANIPSSIFYTFDGADPSLNSNIYISPIFLPTNQFSIILKVFATNGIDSSPIITEIYTTNILNNTRFPHSSTTAPSEQNIANLYPFGTGSDTPNGEYLNPGDAGVTVDNTALPSNPTAYDGNDGYTAYTNQPYNIENYQIVYSTTDAQGQTGPGIGTLPAKTTILPEIPPPEQTDQFTNLFDPRAAVIFQDFSEENPDDPAQINRQFFNSEDPNKARSGTLYFSSGLDAPTVTGAFVKSHYNPRDNTITYYYRDNIANKWIISKTPYQPTGPWDGNLSTVKFAQRGTGSNFVYQWNLWQRRILF